MDKLLPCPFCKGKPAVIEAGYKAIAVHCFNCGADITAETSRKAIAAWNRRAQPENKPLALDELRGMDGEPVWVSDIDPFSQDKCSCWAIVGDAEEAGIELYDKFCDKNYIDFGASELYGKTWLAYRAKPKEVEHE